MFLFKWNTEDMADRVRDHQFLVRMNDADLCQARGRGNHALICRVSLFVELNSKKPQPIANPGADRGRILSDSTSEHQRV